MASKTYKPADIAKELNVSTNTIRGWCNQFSDHLSDRATPQSGRERVITSLDRTVLHYIAGLRNDGFTYDEIASRLAETTFTEDESPEPLTVVTETPETSLEPVDPALVVLASSVQTIAEHLAQSADRSREIDQLRAEVTQLRTYIIIGALGVIIALLLGFLLLITIQ